MMGGVTAVIPARLGSSRFADKVIYQYRGMPLLFYVWNSIRSAQAIDLLVIATDSKEIASIAREFGAEVVMTSHRHQTGSDRVAEAAEKVGGSIVVNVQADCFGLKPRTLNSLVAFIRRNRNVKCATLARKITRPEELANPDTVKVVTATDGRAYWFSRSPLPRIPLSSRTGKFRQSDNRDGMNRVSRVNRINHLAHIGVYAFRREALEEFARQRQTLYEKLESLEQLRLLEHAVPIHVRTTTNATFSIDSPADLKKMDRLHKQVRRDD